MKIVRANGHSLLQNGIPKEWDIVFIEKLAKLLYDGMEGARQMGREHIFKQIERQIANALSFSYDVRSVRAESMLRATAFTVAGIENQEILDVLKSDLTSSLEKGTTFAEWQDKANEAYNSFGVTRTSRRHLEVVFRNNLQTAYNAGRWDAMQEPVMKAEFPLWEYNAILDERTRPSHAAMNGKRYKPDDPIWDTWYPPNGHNCRCSVSMISRIEVEDEKLKANNPPGAIQPDRGWDRNPAKNLKQIREWVDERLKSN